MLARIFLPLLLSAAFASAAPAPTLMITTTVEPDHLAVVCRAPGIDEPNHCFFAALNSDIREGGAVIPYGCNTDGSTVFLPFRANRLYRATLTAEGANRGMRHWDKTAWSAEGAAPDGFTVTKTPGEVRLSIPTADLPKDASIPLAVYVKSMSDNDGWGRVYACTDSGTTGGINDQAVSRFQEVNLTAKSVTWRNRLDGERVRIYQLMPRLFGNTNETRKLNGTLSENGVGKFADLNDAALDAIHALGFTHVWLTGVLRQATSAAYASAGAPADDPDLLKGLAGSPYAIKDYFDVCPDYTENPAQRLDEFKALLERLHRHGLRAIIDFVPNHVARSYQSTVQPDLSFGAHDDRTKFFDAQNNFFYLRPTDAGHGPPLVLPTVHDGRAVSPTCVVLGTCDGKYDGETDHGRVTGNNVVSWTPSINDWYETVKLNYGYDFTTGAREYPNGENREKPLPDTWQKMDRILGYWQELGVDGFRCDMAHMVPPEFWSWAIGRARARRPDVWFMAEAYDNDPAKVRSGDPLLQALNDHHGNVMFDLLNAGFNAVYDDPSYKKLKSLYDGQGWANDLDGSFPHEYIFHSSLRYAENHDEVRLAGHQWGGLGPNVGRAVSGILYGLGRGPLLLYSGQEVGEPARGAEGFGGDDSRTTIFDYWSMPEFTKWVNGHRYDGGKLSPEQTDLRAFYGRLVRLVGEPAFRDGECYPLNATNHDNEKYGRLPGETASGHWLYAFVRNGGLDGAPYLVVANLNPKETLRDVVVRLSPAALDSLRLDPSGKVQLEERLSANPRPPIVQSAADVATKGVTIAEIPPFTPFYFQFTLRR